MARTPRFSRGLAPRFPFHPVSALLAAVALIPGSGAAQTAPYLVVDRVGGAWLNPATFPVRPMVLDPDGRLWVANHLDSTVERFTGSSEAPDSVHGVPWSPVSIAWWDGHGPEPIPELLVVCRGTWAVVGLDPETGAPRRLLQLREGGASLPGALDARIGRMAEPGDILVDQENDRAFVSCSGADSVLQIDLVANAVVRAFCEESDPRVGATSGFRMKSPLHLSWDHDGVRVLVAPLHSGNNSLPDEGLFTATRVIDLDGAITGLPDEDLFRITPFADATSPGSVEVLARGMGTILFAHGINPVTGDFWQLNTEALNKDPARQTEPSVKGSFAENRLSVVDIVSSDWGTTPRTADAVLSLDPGGVAPSALAQPVALAFRPTGHAYLAGLGSDNVIILRKNGALVTEFVLPDGALPRALLQHRDLERTLFVYCWGDNTVRRLGVDLTPPGSATVTLEATHRLRHDPTPPDVAAGRVVFFDASNSELGNLSCATCHVDGGSDFLVWNLSNGPIEEKGPMFTQTLVGIERMAPFHWRGDRQLADFRPAFVGLLGVAPAGAPTDEEFARFEDFVFSLVNPANPNQDRRRVLNADIHDPGTTFGAIGEDHVPHDWTLTGDATSGQVAFTQPLHVNVERHACVDCHAFPTGSNNDINVEFETFNLPRRVSMKPTPFHELWRKRQSLVRVELVEGTTTVLRYPSFLGAGLTHLGVEQDLFRFVSRVTDDVPGTDDDQKANDVADLIHQWDQGLGLAVHYAYLLDGSSSSTEIADELTGYLHGEMVARNCDIAVIGVVRDGSSALVPRRWTWMRPVQLYVCEDPALGDRSLAAFEAGAANGEANLFLGLPRGMAERFAIDYDMDGVRNLDLLESDPYDPDVPGWDDGNTPAVTGTPTIVWASTRIARLAFNTNEPTRAVVRYVEPKTPQETVTSPLLSRHHSVLLTKLRPSTDAEDALDVGSYGAEDVVYTVEIDLTDATSNDSVTHVLQFQTADFIVPAELAADEGSRTESERKNRRAHVVQAISATPQVDLGDKVQVRVDSTVAFKRGAWVVPTGGTVPEPPRAANRVVVGRVLVARADGTVVTAKDAGLAVTPKALLGMDSAALVDGVRIAWPGGTANLAGFPAAGNEFLAGLIPTNADGETAIRFHVAKESTVDDDHDLKPTDLVLFVVEGVLEIDPLEPVDDPLADPLVYNVLFAGAANQWSFPDTGEARAVTKSALVP